MCVSCAEIKDRRQDMMILGSVISAAGAAGGDVWAGSGGA